MEDLFAERFVSTKVLSGYPCSHRQWSHDGHCKFFHGYSRSFHFWFTCTQLALPACFVFDFGQMKGMKSWLEENFDHTALANFDDPQINEIIAAHRAGLLDLRIMPNVGMEATSMVVLEKMNQLLANMGEGQRVLCFKVETRENEKNSGYYQLDSEVIRAWREGQPVSAAYYQRGLTSTEDLVMGEQRHQFPTKIMLPGEFEDWRATHGEPWKQGS